MGALGPPDSVLVEPFEARYSELVSPSAAASRAAQTAHTDMTTQVPSTTTTGDVAAILTEAQRLSRLHEQRHPAARRDRHLSRRRSPFWSHHETDPYLSVIDS